MKSPKILNKIVIALALVGFFNAIAEDNYLDVGYQDEAVSNNKVQSIKPNNYGDPQRGAVIINNNGTSQPALNQQQIVQQPTTYVEANPLAESRADQLRRARQDAEIGTEKKIVEKLEESRLRDEKRRADKLFGNRLNELDPEEQYYQPAAPQVQAPAPVVVAPPVVQVVQDPTPTPAAVVESQGPSKEELVDAVRMELRQHKEDEENANKEKYYISASIGTAEYDEAINVDGNMATGLVFGAEMKSGAVVEAGFHYSNYYIEDYWAYPIFKELDQYNFSMAAKYSLLNGKIKPQVGGMVSYTYRKYFDRGYYMNYYSNQGEAKSQAIDFGFLVGLDVDLSESFSLGVEYRQSMNLTSRNDSEYLGSRFQYRRGEPVEDLSYSMILLSGKVRF